MQGSMVVPTDFYGSKTRVLASTKRRRVEVFNIKRLKGALGVSVKGQIMKRYKAKDVV